MYAYAFLYFCIYVYVHTYAYVCVYEAVCAYVYIYIYTLLCICACVCKSKFTGMCILVLTCVFFVCPCTCTCIYKCLFTCGERDISYMHMFTYGRILGNRVIIAANMFSFVLARARVDLVGFQPFLEGTIFFIQPKVRSSSTIQGYGRSF